MGDGEQGFVGTALSGDGTTVLGFTGGFEPGPDHKVATIPYGGGKVKTLVKNAFEPTGAARRVSLFRQQSAQSQSSRPTWRRIETLSE